MRTETWYILAAGGALEQYSPEELELVREKLGKYPQDERTFTEFQEVPLDTAEKHLERCQGPNVIGVLLPKGPPVDKALRELPDLPHIVLTPKGPMRLTSIKVEFEPL